MFFYIYIHIHKYIVLLCKQLVRELEVGIVELDNKFLNVLLVSLLTCARADLAMEYFERFTHISFNVSLACIIYIYIYIVIS